MQIVVERAAGLDIPKQTVIAAIQTPENRTTRTFSTMTRDLEQLAAWLREQGITQVAMEATGVYWQPVYNVLEEHPFELLVANAQHFKAVPVGKLDPGRPQRSVKVHNVAYVRAFPSPAVHCCPWLSARLATVTRAVFLDSRALKRLLSDPL